MNFYKPQEGSRPAKVQIGRERTDWNKFYCRLKQKIFFFKIKSGWKKDLQEPEDFFYIIDCLIFNTPNVWNVQIFGEINEL